MMANIFGKGGVSEEVLQSRSSPLDVAKYSINYTFYLQTHTRRAVHGNTCLHRFQC